MGGDDSVDIGGDGDFSPSFLAGGEGKETLRLQLQVAFAPQRFQLRAPGDTDGVLGGERGDQGRERRIGWREAGRGNRGAIPFKIPYPGIQE